jgi:hypothetical protein
MEEQLEAAFSTQSVPRAYKRNPEQYKRLTVTFQLESRQ